MRANDYIRYIGRNAGVLKKVQLFFTSPGYTYTVVMRMGQLKIPVIKHFFRFILRFLSRYYGIQIPASTSIGPGLFMGHFGTIVVNNKAIIGRNCNIAQGVTIGQTNRGRLRGVPVIGDEVWIGPNVVIVGKITIGNNVLIAPNTYVNVDVPQNSVVYGNPCIIKTKEDATEGYVNNKV